MLEVISYNLRKNRALCELDALVAEHTPDVLCLQECDVDQLPKRFGELELVEATRGNRLGLSVFASRERFEIVSTDTFPLKKSLHDRIAAPANERLVATRLHDLARDRELLVASFHGAPLTARNALRRKQIATSYDLLASLGPNLPTLMIGDYNYPFFQRHLDRRITARGYSLSASEEGTYQRYKIFRGHYDLATTSGFDVAALTSLPQGTSDHRPILLQASYYSPTVVPVLAGAGAA